MLSANLSSFKLTCKQFFCLLWGVGIFGSSFIFGFLFVCFNCWRSCEGLGSFVWFIFLLVWFFDFIFRFWGFFGFLFLLFLLFRGFFWEVISSLLILLKVSLYSNFTKVLGCSDHLCDARSLLCEPNESNKISFKYLKSINSLLSKFFYLFAMEDWGY